MRTDNGHIEEFLPDYVRGALSEGEQRRVELHLQKCESCSGRAANIRNLFRDIDLLPDPSIPSGFFQNLLPNIRERLSGEEKQSWFDRPFVERYAFPLTALVLAIALMVQSPQLAGWEESSDESVIGIYEGFSDEEILDTALDQNIAGQSLSGPSGQELTSVLPGLVVSNELAGTILSDEGGGIVFVALNPTQQYVYDLSDEEVEVLLQRLSERTIL